MCNWRNDPVTRQGFFDQDEIPWEEHREWFERKLMNQDCIWYLVDDGAGNAVAQVRFDIENDGDAMVSVAAAPNMRNRGYGTEALKLSTSTLMREVPRVSRAIAYIRPENVASKRAFANAGYTYVGETPVHGLQATTMFLEREQKDTLGTSTIQASSKQEHFERL